MKILELYEVEVSHGFTLKVYNAINSLAIEIYLGENLIAQWEKEEGFTLIQEIKNIELMSYCSFLIRELSLSNIFNKLIDPNKANVLEQYITDLDNTIQKKLSDTT